LFGDVKKQISLYALKQVFRTYSEYFPRDPDKPGVPRGCKDHCKAITAGWGLPCIHTIEMHVDDHSSLVPSAFHQQWHLKKNLRDPVPDIIATLREPKTPAGKDRNKRREPSHFERVEHALEKAEKEKNETNIINTQQLSR
jgi:hypothetical protein